TAASYSGGYGGSARAASRPKPRPRARTLSKVRATGMIALNAIARDAARRTSRNGTSSGVGGSHAAGLYWSPQTPPPSTATTPSEDAALQSGAPADQSGPAGPSPAGPRPDHPTPR